jgi:hypothetical protein
MDNWTKEELQRLNAECRKYGLNNSILASKIKGRKKNGEMSRITISRLFSHQNQNYRVIEEIIKILKETKYQIQSTKKEFQNILNN